MSETRLQLETRQEREKQCAAGDCFERASFDRGYNVGLRHGLELAELEARESAEVPK